MKRLLPQGLLGQMLLVLVAGLVVSHAIGWWIYSSDREAAVREVGGLAAAQRIANLTRLLDDAPADWRQRIITASSDPSFRLSLSQKKPDLSAGSDPGPVARAIQAYLVDRLALGANRVPVVASAEAVNRPVGPGMDRGRRMNMEMDWDRDMDMEMGWGRHMNMMGRGPRDGFDRGMGMMMGEPTALIALNVAIPLSSGQWLLVSTALPQASPIYSRQFIISMLAMAAVIIAVSIWAARRVTTPLAELAAAAQRLGQDVNAAPIPETGTIETRQASRAFNEMQAQLRETIENRTRLLAAISHDLRTPLTLLRLRTENVPETEDREKMLATLAEMEAMIGVTLQYARDEIATEPARTTDLTALVASIVDDMVDAGLDVAMTLAPPILLESRPTALKRAITNLVDNAVKYGSKAHVAIRDAAKTVDIVIDDEGPGLPPEELARAFQPFYRVEGSRSRDTGGVGLGLAIVRSLVERHHGTVTLENRPEIGLRARIRLPKSDVRPPSTP